MSKDQWAYWRAALNGLQMDFDKDDVPSGFYEHRNGSIIAIWRDDGGIFCWKTNATQYAPKTKEKVCEYFAYCTGNPSGRAISHDEYLHIMAGGKALAGPRSATIDKPATIGDNSAGMTDDERISAEIKDLSEQFNSWLEKIGKIATQEQADKAAAAALSQGLAVQAAYRNGESFGRAEGYRDGFRAGHTWHTIVGVLWGVAGTIITLGMLGFSAARAAKWLW